MKFAEKYKQLKSGERCDDILRGDLSRKCITCGEPTEFIDIYSEAHMCSEECQDEFYEEMNRMAQLQDDDSMWWEDAGVY